MFKRYFILLAVGWQDEGLSMDSVYKTASEDFSSLRRTTWDIESMLESFLLRSSPQILCSGLLRYADPAAAFLFREAKKVAFSTITLLGAYLWGLGPMLRELGSRKTCTSEICSVKISRQCWEQCPCPFSCCIYCDFVKFSESSSSSGCLFVQTKTY